jgi:hypothetical protein
VSPPEALTLPPNSLARFLISRCISTRSRVSAGEEISMTAMSIDSFCLLHNLADAHATVGAAYRPCRYAPSRSLRRHAREYRACPCVGPTLLRLLQARGPPPRNRVRLTPAHFERHPLCCTIQADRVKTGLGGNADEPNRQRCPRDPSEPQSQFCWNPYLGILSFGDHTSRRGKVWDRS